MAIAAMSRDVCEAAPEDVGMSSARLGRLTRVVQNAVDAKRIPGALTMVARHGKVVHCETYGSMDEEAGKPMRVDTIFRFYSMTKPIASVGLMTLYEEGRFQLDDPASRFIPELKGLKVFAGGTADSFTTRESRREMTVRDLLMHTSGLTSRAGAPGSTASPVSELYTRAGLLGSSSDGTLKEFIAKLGELPLAVDPGAQWIYGVSTDVVGYLCEVLSGQRLDHFLRERVLDRLGMADTAFEVPDAKLDRFAACYQGRVDGSYALVDAPATSGYRKRTYLSAAGGLVSTAHDYMRFCKMLANGGELEGERILGPRTLRLMTLNHLPGGVDLATMAKSGGETSRAGVGFGLGFAMLLDPTVAQVLGTVGEYYWGGAASTAFFVSPGEDLSALFLTQVMNGNGLLRRELRVTTYQAIID
ncbi:MAG TPA: serine hydrolase domain-containing protein [Chloroflexota bacterium]|nr:serine hydrolase domain-containing protein [Chloroflexota bacterium]